MHHLLKLLPTITCRSPRESLEVLRLLEADPGMAFIVKTQNNQVPFFLAPWGWPSRGRAVLY